MKRTHLPILLLLLALGADILRAQPAASYPRIMYVTYDGAPVYDSAHHKGNILGELRLGDSVRALGVAGKYYRITFREREGYLYWPNIAARRPAGKPKGTKGKKGREKKDTVPDAGVKKPAPKLPKNEPAGEDNPTVPDSAAAVSSQENRGGSRGRKSGGKESEGGRCRAVTKAGRQCSRVAADSSGYCWQHRK